MIEGGTAALGRSPLCPPWGRSLGPDDVDALLAWLEAAARPPTVAPGGEPAGPTGLPLAGVAQYNSAMAAHTVKTTYALDVETVRRLDDIARRWNVSKSEALRRAIRAASVETPAEGLTPIQALDRVQRSLCLAPERAARWVAAHTSGAQGPFPPARGARPPVE